jgi:hypothetical protein
MIPHVLFRTADMAIVEGSGIPPDVLVDHAANPDPARRDVVIEAARAWLACPACVGRTSVP